MKEFFKRGLRSLAASFLGMLPPRRVAVILAYHGIAEPTDVFTISPEAFERQMRYLKRKRFNVMSLDTIAEFQAAGTISPKTVAITFDDGWADIYTTAFPILKTLGFPAAVFPVTGDASPEDLRRTAPRLTEEELRDMSASGLITVGSHSQTHRRLTRLSPPEVEREINESKASIERITEKPCKHFAYPFGRANPSIREIVARAGYRFAYLIQPRSLEPNTDPYSLPRFEIHTHTGMAVFRAIVRGRGSVLG